MVLHRKTLRELDVQSRHFIRCEIVLALIDMLDKPTLEDIEKNSDLPKRTIHGIFQRLRDQHRVLIERVNGRRHGYYKIVDWGNLDRERILAHVNSYSLVWMPDERKSNEVERETV